MIRILLLVCLLLLSGSSIAQPKGFVSGYIVDLKGDTTKGLIKALPELQSCKYVIFLKEGQTAKQAVTYNPSQLNGYNRFGRSFISFQSGSKPVFAELLEQGRMKLYAVYTSNSGDKGGGVFMPGTPPGFGGAPGGMMVMGSSSPEYKKAKCDYYLQKASANNGEPQEVGKRDLK